MINYLVNFTLCSALLLLAYQFLLKNKAMYQFNRAYLLLAIIFSLAVPFIAVTRTVAPLPPFVEMPVGKLLTGDMITTTAGIQPHTITITPVDYVLYGCVVVYSIVTLLLLVRFIKNLYTISASIKQNTNITYKNARLVLIDGQQIPHTFLNCIFLNRQAHNNGKIENEILQHELAHARQLHSIDVLLIELVQVFCWFNPALAFYRKAIQLNHEFIADAAVLDHGNDLGSYQNLLISKLSEFKSLTITSQFNYSVTKKRLIMMTKTTSATAALFSRLAIIPVFVCAFMLFCNKTDAHQPEAAQTKTEQNLINSKIKKDTTKITVEENSGPLVYPSTKDGVPADSLNEYKGIINKYMPEGKTQAKAMLKITPEDRERMVTIFKQMSRKQQREQLWGFTYPGEPLAPSAPTQAQLNNWKNAKTYGVWINNKRIKNADLANYQPGDFGQFLVSRLTKIAVKNDGFRYQVGLMTAAYYAKYCRDARANRYSSMMYYHIPMFIPEKG